MLFYAHLQPKGNSNIMKTKKKENDALSCRLGKVGGQAVLEGVMMKSGERCSLAVRMADGKINLDNSTHVSLRKKHKICDIPVIRGCVSFVEQMLLAMENLKKLRKIFLV